MITADMTTQAATTMQLCDKMDDARYDGLGPVAFLAILAVLMIGFWLGRLSAWHNR